MKSLRFRSLASFLSIATLIGLAAGCQTDNEVEPIQGVAGEDAMSDYDEYAQQQIGQKDQGMGYEEGDYPGN